MKLGLVLEGGGMRGVYTAGVLDALMDFDVQADYVIGVSAGAGNGASYVSRQRGRALRTNVDFLGDRRYLGLSCLRRTGSLFGMDFIFDQIPNQLIPFDYAAFAQNPCAFVAGVTDAESGRPVYFDKSSMPAGDCSVLRASASLPVFSPMVQLNGRMYLDGGTSDPIPVARALSDGCGRLIIVLTRQRGYIKKPEKLSAVYRRRYRQYPQLVKTLDERHILYNQALKQVYQLEREGTAVVIAPSRPPQVSRFEKNPQKLMQLYALGINDAMQAIGRIRNLCGGGPRQA